MPRGFAGVRKAAEKVEAKRAAAQGSGALWLKLEDKEVAVVRFLEQGDDIFWANMHDVPVEGRKWPDNVPCMSDEEDGDPSECPGCDKELKRSFKGYINLIWRDAPVFKRDEKKKIVKDKDGDPIVTGHKDQIAILSSGIRLFEQLDEVDDNFGGLMSRDFKIKRRGSGLDTKYTINPADPDGGAQKMSKADNELADEKYDLNDYTKPPSREDWLKKLGVASAVANGASQSAENAKSNNPFKRRKKSDDD